MLYSLISHKEYSQLIRFVRDWLINQNCFYHLETSLRLDHKEENHSSLRIVYILSEHIERVIDSALEVGRVEALS